MKTSDYGILSGSFTLANEVNSGMYKLVVKTDVNETTKSFKVNPYVLPKYEVKIDFDKENYLVGDTATINLNAKYFFGEPVSNAKFDVYIDNKIYQTIVADNQGNANVKYVIKDGKNYLVKVEAVDSSNYFVEESKNFTAGTDIFELEVLPEYGNLIASSKNDIYVFTSNADGSPLKTYVTVSVNNYTKQVVTNEDGIGKFSIDIGTIPNNYNSSKNIKNEKTFKISAVNMSGEEVTKDVSFVIENKNLVVSTDKVKYNQGEDIKINISSEIEKTKNIYFFKNNKLLKMISTDLSETTINLDDEYGLIDVYVSQGDNYRSAYYYDYYSGYRNLNSYKKTIFVKPEKELNININTDKSEYKPGDNITISFGTTDEANNNIESALLVSMLDNAILNLADNDLSIDNIKLALSGINFADDLDAATLYSCIVDEKSEQTMMALLLKQSNNDIKVSETSRYYHDEEETAAMITIISIFVIIFAVILYLGSRFPKFRILSKHFLNVIIYVFTVVMFSLCILEEYFWRVDYSWWAFAITTLVCLATYIAWLSKHSSKMLKTSISILVTLICLAIISIVMELWDVSGVILVTLLAFLIFVFAILYKVNDVKKLKCDKLIKKLAKKLLYACKFLLVVAISIFIGTVIEEIIDIDVLTVPVCIVLMYLLNYKFNKIGKNVTDGSNDEKIDTDKNDFGSFVMTILAIIGILAMIGPLSVLDYSVTNDAVGQIESLPMNDASMGVIPNIAPGSSSSAGGFLSFDSISKDETQSTDSSKTENVSESENVTDDNIRNIFLESMCFIPELVTTNGNAKLDLKLSDNITTWTIQTVGNTKDGRIGYGSLDTVKVFKEFFVDFELPKNLVETDKVSIPVTVYNYTPAKLNASLQIKEADWFKLEGNGNIDLIVEPESTKMVYIPIAILKNGNFNFRVEVTSDSLTDIVEKGLTISPKGYKVEKVVSTGNMNSDISEDVLILEDFVEGTASAKVKIYASAMSQTIEGMENIFRMPTGCFEQTSSSLYPNILALKYLEDTGTIAPEIKEKALEYISSGYQRLLTFEVRGEEGGYSLFGNPPAENVLTAYGLMELTDLKEVYSVDEKVLQDMSNFLYKHQNSNGSFEITGHATGENLGGAGSSDRLALNAYIIWALTESNPKDERLSKSIAYLKGKLDDVDDNYTLALIANCLANVEDKAVDGVIKRLINNITLNGTDAYVTSNVVDYYGSRGNSQTIQTTALTSMALSKTSANVSMNSKLINYLIAHKDAWGTWYSTQATILSLKALNEANLKSKLENQTIVVKMNSEEQKLEIKDNPLEIYELTFNNLQKENKLNIDMEKGNAYYEIVETYYVPYENVDISKDNIKVTLEANRKLKVNEILDAKIKVTNSSNEEIYNGMVTINIPQGFTVIEDGLMLLESEGIIDKYEMTYGTVNVYLRNFAINQIIDLDVKFRAAYPVGITGLAIRAYDYYNPEVEGRSMPVEISVIK